MKVLSAALSFLPQIGNDQSCAPRSAKTFVIEIDQGFLSTAETGKNFGKLGWLESFSVTFGVVAKSARVLSIKSWHEGSVFIP